MWSLATNKDQISLVKLNSKHLIVKFRTPWWSIRTKSHKKMTGKIKTFIQLLPHFFPLSNFPTDKNNFWRKKIRAKMMSCHVIRLTVVKLSNGTSTEFPFRFKSPSGERKQTKNVTTFLWYLPFCYILDEMNYFISFIS